MQSHLHACTNIVSYNNALPVSTSIVFECGCSTANHRCCEFYAYKFSYRYPSRHKAIEYSGMSIHVLHDVDFMQ